MINSFQFTCKGHQNITATHLTTLEFTKEEQLSLRGDCVVGVGAHFNAAMLQEFLEGAQMLEIAIHCGGLKEQVRARYNPTFRADREIVVRRGPFASDRTLASEADRACMDFSRAFVEMIKNSKAVIHVEIKRIES